MVLFPVEKALRAGFGNPHGVPWGLELRTGHAPQYNYNHRRPYQALNWQTPAERRAKNLSPKVERAA